MGTPIFIVDAFTARPFAGNPAAVCLPEGEAGAAWMQQVAAEMNLSETAFVTREGDAWRLRWFTPKVEVDLCGHATLASAHVLWQTGACLGGEPVRFVTRSGVLTATQAGGAIELDFPALPADPCVAPPGLAEALGVAPILVANTGMDVLCELADADELRRLAPDFGRLAKVPTRGVIVTCRSDAAGYDFLSRFFAPGAGVAEDPVTGSAHCALGPFWAGRLNKSELVGYQASRRGGEVRVRVVGGRVRLLGHAVTVVRGELVAA